MGGGEPSLRSMEEFNSALLHSGVSSVSFDGSPFTWTNGRVWQRLDRVLINAEWSAAYSFTRLSHLSRGRSDHCPLLIKCGHFQGRKSTFRFLNVWRHHKEFIDVVKQDWDQPIASSGMQGFFLKLMRLRKRLSVWNKETFGNVANKVKEAADVLLARELEYDQQRDEASKSRLNEARAKHTRMLALESELLRQKSSVKWLQAGDANTADFHSVVPHKRNVNFIGRIKDSSENWIENLDDIKSSAVEFFSNLFK